MGVINYQAEMDEIKQWLTANGVHPVDHPYISDKLKTDQAAHLRHLQMARNARAKTKH